MIVVEAMAFLIMGFAVKVAINSEVSVRLNLVRE